MPFTSERFAFGGERLCDSRKPFSALLYDRRVFGSAQPCAKHSPAFGARTGRALQNCCARSKGEANAAPLARSLRGGARSCAAIGASRAGAPTIASPAQPQRARRPLSQWTARPEAAPYRSGLNVSCLTRSRLSSHVSCQRASSRFASGGSSARSSERQSTPA